MRSTDGEKQAQIDGLAACHAAGAPAAAAAVKALQQTALEGGNVFASLMDAAKVLSLGQMSAALYQSAASTAGTCEPSTRGQKYDICLNTAGDFRENLMGWMVGPVQNRAIRWAEGHPYRNLIRPGLHHLVDHEDEIDHSILNVYDAHAQVAANMGCTSIRGPHLYLDAAFSRKFASPSRGGGSLPFIPWRAIEASYGRSRSGGICIRNQQTRLRRMDLLFPNGRHSS